MSKLATSRKTHTFLPRASRDAIVKGTLEMRFTSEELAANEVAITDNVAIESIDDIELHPQNFD